jgi:hypothetical protein
MKYELAFPTLSTNLVDKSTRTSVSTSATRTTARGSAMTLTNHIPDATKMVSVVKDSLTTQQEQGEPVAWMYILATTIKDGVYGGWENKLSRQKPNAPEGAVNHIVPLYTTPQQRKPLTDEQMRDCLDAADQMYCEKDGDKELFKARAIEAAHNIKE